VVEINYIMKKNKTLIVLLRGINVGGKRKILMGDLRMLLGKNGYSEVRTYIQSGNILLQSDKEKDIQKIEIHIQKLIEEAYGFVVSTVVLPFEILKKAYANKPFPNPESETISLHLTILQSVPDPDLVKAIANFDAGVDRFQIKEQFVYLRCEGKYHKSKLTNNFFEKKLKVSATTRNWRTLGKLIEMGE